MGLVDFFQITEKRPLQAARHAIDAEIANQLIRIIDHVAPRNATTWKLALESRYRPNELIETFLCTASNDAELLQHIINFAALIGEFRSGDRITIECMTK
jgi:hypothetical protein